MKYTVNPAYYELEHYPFAGVINGYFAFDRTKPRLSDEAYLKQCEQLGIMPQPVMNDNIRYGLDLLSRMENQP